MYIGRGIRFDISFEWTVAIEKHLDIIWCKQGGGFHGSLYFLFGDESIREG